MANQTTEQSGGKSSRLREAFPAFGVIGRLDDAVYSFERAVVTLSLIIMTFASFTKVVYDYFSKVLPRIADQGWVSGEGVKLGIGLLLVVIVGRLAAGTSKAMQSVPALAWLVGVFTGLITVVYIYLVSKADSATVAAILTVVGIVVFLFTEFGRPRPIRESGRDVGSIVRPAIIVVVGALMIYGTRNIHGGYSWAANLSLTLLLWMAFFGASMATYQKRHLTVDAIRKLIPKRRERLFNALSFLVSAAFTAVLLKLSWDYYQLRLTNSGSPGQVPDSIKILSIPLSLLLITLRFGAYSLAEFAGASRGVEPEEVNALEEVH